jgi:hypothetical protein
LDVHTIHQAREIRAAMAEVFISYAKADRNLAQQLVSNLEAHGRTTWWDTDVDAHRGPGNSIERELESAQKVIVLWSKASIASPFVLYEAIAARDAGKLVQVKTADIRASDIVRPLRMLPLLDLGDLSGIADALHERQKEVSDLASEAEGRSSVASPTEVPERSGFLAQKPVGWTSTRDPDMPALYFETSTRDLLQGKPMTQELERDKWLTIWHVVVLIGISAAIAIGLFWSLYVL